MSLVNAAEQPLLEQQVPFQYIEPLDPIMEAIAVCESNNVATARNPRSTAKGRFQFLDSSWEYYGKQLWGEDFDTKDVFNYADNTELAYWTKEKYGYSAWSECL